MSKINLLQPNVFNMISAGEVVERPSSVVKELVENSIDAGATSIDILVEQGGLLKIQVSDNGVGIEKDDMRNAFLPHATSKLKNITDDSKNRDTNEMLLSSAKKNVTAQVSLFDSGESKIERQIRDTDVDNLTPLQALTILSDLKKQLEND